MRILKKNIIECKNRKEKENNRKKNAWDGTYHVHIVANK